MPHKSRWLTLLHALLALLFLAGGVEAGTGRITGSETRVHTEVHTYFVSGHTEGAGADSPAVLVHNISRFRRMWTAYKKRTPGSRRLSKKQYRQRYDAAQSRREPYVTFNRSHSSAKPHPGSGVGPGGGALQSHHGLQDAWAQANLPGYSRGRAPTITLETGKGPPAFAHTIISRRQNARQLAREAAGQGSWSSSLQQELGYMVGDLRAAGFGKSTISRALGQQYSMLDKLGVSYSRIPGF